MNRSTVVSLANVLFKSFFRASRPGRRSFWANPRVLIVIDLVLFVVPFGLLAYALPQALPLLPATYHTQVQHIALNILEVLPIALTAAVIVSGVLFELGQSSGLASSEAVNWLPVSPNEYVLASSASIAFTYSPMLFICFGFAIPFAATFGLLSTVPLFICMSIVAYFWGAFLVEAIRSVMNRISSSMYKKSGRTGLALRIILAIVLLVLLQSAFNPYFLYIALSNVVSGISLIWFVPMIWPSVAVVYSLENNIAIAAAFTTLSLILTFLIFEGTSRLRTKYWSPMPVSITLSISTVYVPQGRSLLWLDPVAYAVASKDIRSLTRRREMTRYLAIPAVIVVASLLPVLTSGGGAGNSLAAAGVFLLAEISLIVPMMLSAISIGQEGKSISNIFMLPISAKEMMNGKLFFAWILSSTGIIAIAVIEQILSPNSILTFIAILFPALLNILIQGYNGLAAGSQYPNFTVGPRARYITTTGFFVAFVTALPMTLGLFAPLIIYQSGFFATFGTYGSGLVSIGLTAAVGIVLIIISRFYCLQSIKKLLSNMEA